MISTTYFMDKFEEPDPAYANFKIQKIENMFLATVFNTDGSKEYPGQCVITSCGEVFLSDFSKDMTEVIQEEVFLLLKHNG